MPSRTTISSSGGAVSASMLAAVAKIAVSLRGGGDFIEECGSVATLLGAERAIVSRIDGDRVRQVCLTDRNAGRLLSERRPHSFARAMLSVSDLPLRPGVVLSLSGLRADGYDGRIAEAKEKADGMGIGDVAVTILGVHAEGYDVLELQFEFPTSEATDAQLTALAPALAICWGDRLPGTAQAIMAQARCRAVQRADAAPEKDILDPDNPVSLSRSEFRICSMIRAGMVPKDISESLGIRESTMRSHLHSIYSKTGTSGQVDLLHRLTRSARDASRARDVLLRAAAG